MLRDGKVCPAQLRMVTAPARILSPGPFAIKNVTEYMAVLAANKVVFDPKERKKQSWMERRAVLLKYV